MNVRSRLFVLGLALALFGAALPALSASTVAGQQPDPKKEAQLRTVHGVTMDKSESPVPSAVVFLKNTRSNAIRSYISDDQGNYRFSGLDPNTRLRSPRRKRWRPIQHPHHLQLRQQKGNRRQPEARQEEDLSIANSSGYRIFVLRRGSRLNFDEQSDLNAKTAGQVSESNSSGIGVGRFFR